MFYQLLSNAVRFTLNGSITIDIDFIHGKDILSISVTDTGIGMVAPAIKYFFFP